MSPLVQVDSLAPDTKYTFRFREGASLSCVPIPVRLIECLTD